jgi:hypothetical protein
MTTLQGAFAGAIVILILIFLSGIEMERGLPLCFCGVVLIIGSAAGAIIVKAIIEGP